MSAVPFTDLLLTLWISIQVTCLLTQSTSTSPTPAGSRKEGKKFYGYGVMIDGGSSSSKLRIYGWNPPQDQKRVPSIELLFTKSFPPGIHTFFSHWTNMTRYLTNILDTAVKEVPVEHHSDTPIYFMATAGVRTLRLRDSGSLFDQIRRYLSKSPFAYHPERVSVLSGEEEGVYSWIAANYLLGFFDTHQPDVNKSVGILEMGGASMQIAFIPRDFIYAEKYQVTIAGTKYQIYVQSYMKFGGTAIKERIADVLARDTVGGSILKNPCMLKGDEANIKLESGITYRMQGAGSGLECQSILEKILQPNQGYGCQPKPCAIGSVHQPSVDDITFYAIQAFVYTPDKLKTIGANNTLLLGHLEREAIVYCSKNLKDVENITRHPSDECLMGLYIPTLFIQSYGFSNATKNIKVTSRIKNQSIDWALGLMLIELSNTYTHDSSDYIVTHTTTTTPEVTVDYVRGGASFFSVSILFVICNLVCTSFMFNVYT